MSPEEERTVLATFWDSSEGSGLFRGSVGPYMYTGEAGLKGIQKRGAEARLRRHDSASSWGGEHGDEELSAEARFKRLQYEAEETLVGEERKQRG